MINPISAAIKGIRASLAAGHSGWEAVVGGAPLPVIGRRSQAGTMVSPETAMTLSAVWACVSRTASLIASLPLDLYFRETDGKRTKVSDNDLLNLLKISPNADQTGFEFWEGMTAHMVMRGNAVSERLMIGSRLVGLRPLINCDPVRNSDGVLVYRFYDRGQRMELPADNVFHMRGFGAGDGLGLSAMRYGVQSLGSALAADESAGSLFANAMSAFGVLETDQSLDVRQREQLQGILDTYSGSQKTGKIMALPYGLKYKQLQMNPEDAQLLETRRFAVEEICRWFGIPPVIIGHSSEGQTMFGTGVESVMLSWLTTGINPMLKRIEARLQRDLVMPILGKRFYFEFNREAMVQMDSKAKAELLSSLWNVGMISSDEGRGMLNLPARGGAADQLMGQLAMAPLETLKGSAT